MSKKMMKRSLALGALMAFVITGSAMAADGEIIISGTTPVSFGDELANYKVDADSNSDGRIYVIDARDDDATTIKLSNYANVEAIASELQGNNQARGIQLQNDTFSAADGLKINTQTDKGLMSQGMYLNTSNATITGDLIITSNNKNLDNKTGWLDSRSMGLALESGSSVIVNGAVDITASGHAFTQGIYAADTSSVTINGNANIVSKSTRDGDSGSDARGVNLEAVKNSKQRPTIVFNGDTTTINTSAENGVVTSVFVSGGSAKADFTDSTVTIIANSKDESLGIYVAGDDSQIISSGDFTVTATATEGTAYGILNSSSVDFEETNIAGSVSLTGKSTISAVSEGTGNAYGIYGESGSSYNLKDTNITANSETGKAYAIYAVGSEIDISGDAVISVKGNPSSNGLYITSGSSVDLSGNMISINAEATDAANGMVIWGSEVNLGSDTTSNIDVVLNVGEASNPTNISKGIWLYDNNSRLIVNGKTLNVDITTEAGPAFGIYAQNPGGHTETGLPVVEIGEDTKTEITIVDKNGNAVGHAISAMGGSIIDIKGDTYINAKNAIVARGNSTVNIGQEDKIVQLNGDILFDYASNSGTTVDAVVNVVLDGEQSYLKGNIIADTEPEDKVGTLNGMGLYLTKGATWELSQKSDVNIASFGSNTNLVLNGDGTQFTQNGNFALSGAGNADKLVVENDALISIEGIKANKYNIATGYENVEADKYWTLNNNLMQGTWEGNAKDGLILNVSAKEAGQIAAGMGVDSGTASALGSIIAAANSNTAPDTPEAQNVKDFANALASAPADVAADAANAVIKMAEAGGNSATAASIVKNVTGVTNDRLSFNCGHSAPHKGGHGVGLFEEGSGADIWVEYVHGKDKVEDMPSTAGATSYEGQYNGFVMGVDFKKVNKFQSGVAFNYGEGDTNSVGTSSRTHSDYDFWGVGYYGNIHNDDSNIIFDINYAKSDSDVKNTSLGINYEASPETTTWTAGVKVEKLYQNDNVQIVPYTGLRYMSIDSDDYATKCGTYKYSMDRQDIWLLPVGVSIRQEVTNDNGWTVSPRVDLSYIWAFGDTDSNMEFATALNTKTNIGYDVMDDGSFLGLVGIEAHKGQWGYGVSYSYQKGDHSESKKWFVDVNYSF